MDWHAVFKQIDIHLPDTKIQKDIAQFLEAVGYSIIYDGILVNFPRNTKGVIEEKMVVSNLNTVDGGYFFTRVRLLSQSGDAGSTVYLGVVSIMYDLSGNYVDDFYKR